MGFRWEEWLYSDGYRVGLASLERKVVVEEVVVDFLHGGRNNFDGLHVFS